MKTKRSLLFNSRLIKFFLLVFLFGLGMLIRFYDFTDYPLDFHATRQLHSALIARGMYYENLDNAPEWQREIALAQWKAEPHVEPQILERLVAMTYQILGSELLWVARLYSILFWIIGGFFLYLLAKDLAGEQGALVSLIFYLFLPYGALASRSFQPDPWLVCMIITALWSMNYWVKEKTWKRALLAGLLSGLAILVKSTAVFFIGGAWLGIVLSDPGLLKALRSKQVWSIAILSILPYIFYHIYGVYLAGFLQQEFNLRFFPEMWSDLVFYLQWNGEISSVIGFAWFLLALMNTLLVKKDSLRGMMYGLWAGYFIYGLTLPYHIATHDYYQLPLIPVVALGLGAGSQVLFNNLKTRKKLAVPAIAAILLFAIVIKSWDVRVTLKRDNYQNEVTFWQQLGERIDHDAEIVGLTQDSGVRLAYWGWVNATQWLSSSDFNLRSLAEQQYDIKELFEDTIKGKDYFIVTMFQELEAQSELKELLSGYAIYEDGGDYIIYDLHQPLTP